MSKRKQTRKKRLQKLIIPVIGVFLMLYFVLELFTGQRSMMVWNHLKEQVQGLQSENLSLSQQAETLERNVMRLKAESLDADYMDEQIRKNLPMSQPNEKIIILKE